MPKGSKGTGAARRKDERASRDYAAACAARDAYQMQAVQRCLVTMLVMAGVLGPTGMLLYSSAYAKAPSTTEWLRAEAGAEWTAITSDPFVDQLADGTLPNATLARYLVQDHQFLDPFVVLLASSVASAPTLEDRLPAARFLGLVAGEENTYFERAFDALDLTKADRAAPPRAETTAFDELMRRAAVSGKRHAQLAVLVVAEWSYLSWGEKVTPAADLSWLHLDWIDLHRGEYFESVVRYLRGQLDALDLDDAALAETKEYFLAAVKCEKDFWAMSRADEEREL